MTDPFAYTLIPIIPEEKVPALGSGWHYPDFAYGVDYRAGDTRQEGHVTSANAELFVIDVDERKPYGDGTLPPEFADTHLGALLLKLAQAFPLITYVSASSPQTKQHWYVDTRGWEGDWPQQWATHQWSYDVKSNGFVRAEPAYSPLYGMPARLPGNVIGLILTAIDHDRALHEQLAAEHNGTAQGISTGATSRWTLDMPDASITDDNTLTAAIMSMVAHGLEDDEVWEETARVRCPLEEDWSDEQIQGKIDSARLKMESDPLVVRRFLESFVSDTRRGQITAEAEWAFEQRKYHLSMGIPHPGQADVPDYGGDGFPESLTPFLPGSATSSTEGEGAWEPRGFTDQQVALSCLDEVFRRGRHRFVRELGRLIERRGDAWEVLTDKDGAAAALLSHLAWSLPDSAIPYDKADAKKLHEESAGWAAELEKLDPDSGPAAEINESKAKLAEYKKFEQKMRFQNSATCGGIVTKMRSLMDAHPVTISALELDDNPDVLWAGGIPWDIASCQQSPRVHVLSPHLLTTGYAPDFSGRPTPLFDQWMAAVLPDQDIRDWMLNLMGATIAGGGKIIPELISRQGGTGKTSMVQVFADVLGSYSQLLPEDLLTGQQAHPEVYLRLKGKKLAYFDEQPGKGAASRNKLKSLAGGSELSGRGVNGREVVSFKPSHSLWLSVNEDVPLGDEAVQLRIRRVYFRGDTGAVTRAVKGIWNTSRTMTDAWRAEAPAVLGMLMRRAAAYIADPNLTTAPPAAELELINAVAEQDTVYEWFTSSIQDKRDSRVSNDLLRSNYTDWCKRVGISEVRRIQDSIEFGRLLSKAAVRCGVQVKQYKSGSTRGWEGMALNAVAQMGV